METNGGRIQGRDKRERDRRDQGARAPAGARDRDRAPRSRNSLFGLSLPVHPVIDPSARCRTGPLSRSAKLDHIGAVVGGFVGKVDEQRPLIPGQASANDVLNALVVHGAVSFDHLACEHPQCAWEMAHLGGKLLDQPADQRLRSPARISHQPCAQGSLQNLGSMETPRERHCLYRLGAFIAARGRRPLIRLFGSGIAPGPNVTT